MWWFALKGNVAERLMMLDRRRLVAAAAAAADDDDAWNTVVL